MTPAEARFEIIEIAAELCRYPLVNGRESVYIKRDTVNGDMCDCAVRLKRIADKLCPPLKGK